MLLLELFISFFQIGLFSFGGGMAAMPLIENQVVDFHGWLTLTEFTDLVTISEMTPGPIAINASTFVGTQIAGLPGAIIATLGCVLPSCIIVLILARLYLKYKELTAIQGILSGLRPAVVSLIASAGITIFMMTIWGGSQIIWALESINFISLALFSGGLFILRKWKPSPIIVMLGCGAIGGVIYSFI